jgi:hypothetical protein
MGGVPGPDARARRARKAAEQLERRAEARRRGGNDAGALEPCAWCGERHPPGFCQVPAEHELVCVRRSGRCPRACVGVCLLSLECPQCHAKDGAWCTRPSGHKAMDIHEDRLRAADRIAIDRVPEQVRAAHGEEGLRLWRRLLGMDGRCATDNLDSITGGPGRICPVANVRCEAAVCMATGCTAGEAANGQQVLDLG